MDKTELKDTFYNIAMMLFNQYRPNENIEDNSVIIGTIYESTYSYSCQIRFTCNDVIVRCKYLKKAEIYNFEFYECTHNNSFTVFEDDATTLSASHKS